MHPGLLNLLLMHREFVARLSCVRKCVGFLSKLHPQCCCSRNLSLQISPGQEFETEKVFMHRITWLYGIPTAVIAA